LADRSQRAAIVKFLKTFAEVVIRTIIFVVPTTYVAQWCDVPPTGKSAAFMVFFLLWYDIVSGPKRDAAEQDDPSSVKIRRAAANVMTPAEVAAEARKLGRQPKPSR
jgi:hypothetical protein